MLIQTRLTIAYKCQACGSYEFFNSSLFQLFKSHQFSAICHCNHSEIIIQEQRFNDYRLSLTCIGCGKIHGFILDKKLLLSGALQEFKCTETGIVLCLIGRDGIVRARVDHLEREMDALIDQLGYERYFTNTRVMLDAFNKVHDIAEQQKLICPCGNHEMSIVMFADKILLQCKNCDASKFIFAASNQDLKEILKMKQILLEKNMKPGIIAITKKILQQ